MNSGSTPNYQLTINDAFTYLNVSTQEQQNFALASIITPIFQYAYQHFYTRSEVLADTMVAQALQQRNYQWVSEQSLWATVVMPLMTFFEGFVYAITPFCAMLFFYGTFGLGLIGKYLQTLFWINLWMPIMAICNLYISLSVSGQLQGINLGSMDGVSTAISTLQNQIATGGMLMTATPLLALMVVTGSTYAFTTLASRLNGGDHVDEKIMAPSSVKVGDVFDQQAFQQANRGAGHLSTGKQAVYENISFGQQVSSLISSSDQLVNSISGTPVVVKHFRIKFFFSLAKQDLFPYFFGCLGILFEVKCVCCCIQKRPIYQSLQAVSRTSIDSICLP